MPVDAPTAGVSPDARPRTTPEAPGDPVPGGPVAAGGPTPVVVAAEPTVNFVWSTGADSLLTLDGWERWEEIARTMPMAVYARPGATFRATRSKAAVALEEFRLPEDKAAVLADSEPPAWVYLRGVMSAQSSTAIRKAKATNGSASSA